MSIHGILLSPFVCTIYAGPHINSYRAKLKNEIIEKRAIDSHYLSNPFWYNYEFDKECYGSTRTFIDYISREPGKIDDEFSSEAINILYTCISKYENVYDEKIKRLNGEKNYSLDNKIKDLDDFKKEVNAFKDVLNKDNQYSKQIDTHKKAYIERQIARDIEGNILINPFSYADKTCYEVGKKFLEMEFILSQEEIQKVSNCIAKYKNIHQDVNKLSLDKDKDKNISYTNIEAITSNLYAFAKKLRNVFKRLYIEREEENLSVFEQEFTLYKKVVAKDQQESDNL
jgi:hypothetical protein